MLKSFLIFYCALILLLSGCNGKIAAGISSPPPNSLVAEDDILGEYIDTFATEINHLGKTASEFYALYDMATYHWYSESAEAFAVDDQIILFSDEIYNQDAKSTAILFSNYTGLTLADIRTDFGNKLEYHDEILLDFYENGFYKLLIDKYTFTFILNATKDGLYEGRPNVMVQMAGSARSALCEAGTIELLNHFDASDRIPQSMRTGQAWDGINEFTFGIGKKLDELQKDIAGLAPANERILDKFYATSGLTDEYGIHYLASTEDNICRMILIPVETAFQGNGPFLMTFLKETFNTHFSWSGYNGNGYMFYFDDVKILVTSNSSGVIESQDFVIVTHGAHGDG